MSQWKRTMQERSNGKPFLPRLAWRHIQNKIPKLKDFKKPYRLERRLVNPDEVSDWTVARYGYGEWRNAHRRYKTRQSGLMSIKALEQNMASEYFNARFDYRLTRDGKESE